MIDAAPIARAPELTRILRALTRSTALTWVAYVMASPPAIPPGTLDMLIKGWLKDEWGRTAENRRAR